MAGLLETLGKPPPGEEDDGAPIDDAKSKKKRAIKRFWAAQKSGDIDAGAEAFADAFRACESYESEATDEGDDEEM